MTTDLSTFVGTGPFAGLKVWEPAWVGVGPLSGKYFADYGATVIRTESSRNPDVLRNGPPFKDGVPGINRSHFFGDYNSSKFGFGVHFGSPEGREIGLQLAQWADVVLESFTPGVMARLGLGYEDLRKVNPDIIMLSTCMNGQSGPRKSFAGFGTVMAAMAGFSAITGWPDRDPGSPYGAYTDFVCQRICASTMIAALDYRRRTGKGQYIDVAQYEGGVQMLASAVLDYTVNDRVAMRDGNRDPNAAPHGIFPCQREDDDERWVAIAVESDEEWRTFGELIGSPDWSADPKFATLAGRKEHEDELEELVGQWTATRTSQDVFELLQPQIAAAPVHTARDLQADAQVVHRRYLRELQHSVMGPTLYEGNQAEMSMTPAFLHKAAPCLGEDTRAVMSQILGYSDEQIDELLDAGVIEEFIPEEALPDAELAG